MSLKPFAVAAVILFGVSSPFGVSAQEAQTLADIRQEATILSVELAKLKRELSTTGAPNTQVSGGSTLQRVDLMGTSLARLTAKIEELEFRIERVVADGTNQLDDLNFRLCELEAGCDIGALPPLEPLGGDTGGASDVVVGPALGSEIPMDGVGQLAEAEQADFDAARASYDAGDYEIAEQSFLTFAQTYTGGHLTGEAHYMRGEALTQLGRISDAARAYLDSFNDNAEGDRAPGALLRLGTSMVALGHKEQGCVMLNEVSVRFPGSAEALEAQGNRNTLGCL